MPDGGYATGAEMLAPGLQCCNHPLDFLLGRFGGQPKPLAEALIRLLEDAPLREALGQAARQRYLQNFNAELMTRRTIELYQRL